MFYSILDESSRPDAACRSTSEVVELKMHVGSMCTTVMVEFILPRDMKFMLSDKKN